MRKLHYEVTHVYSAIRLYHTLFVFRTILYQSNLFSCSTTIDRCHPGSFSAHGHCHPAQLGSERRKTLSKLSSHPQSSRLLDAVSEPGVVALAGEHLFPTRSHSHGPGCHHRTPARCPDC